MSIALDRDASVLAAVPGINDLPVDGAKATFTVGEAELGGVLGALSRYAPPTLVSSPPSLEDLFLRHYGGPGADSASSDGASSDAATATTASDAAAAATTATTATAATAATAAGKHRAVAR